MAESEWSAVDAYFDDKLIGRDAALDAALEANDAAGLPAIDVAPLHGKMLSLMARMAGARRILEIGALGGYSTIWLARALPEDGRLVSLEIDPRHAEVARSNLARAGLAGKAEIRVGPALDTLATMSPEADGPFDFAFIDADKRNNAAYVEQALRLCRSGAAIVVDNVVRDGRVLQASGGDPNVEGVRRGVDLLSGDPRLDATAVQTVGAKGWDGFALALVK